MGADSRYQAATLDEMVCQKYGVSAAKVLAAITPFATAGSLDTMVCDSRQLRTREAGFVRDPEANNTITWPTIWSHLPKHWP